MPFQVWNFFKWYVLLPLNIVLTNCPNSDYRENFQTSLGNIPAFGLNQIIFIGLRSSKDYYKRPGGSVGIWEGSLGCEFLRGSMCAEGMGCRRRWVRWVLRGTGTASGHPGVPWKISPTIRWLSQPDSPNGEGELVTAGTASLLVELECVAT